MLTRGLYHTEEEIYTSIRHSKHMIILRDGDWKLGHRDRDGTLLGDLQMIWWLST